MDRPQDQGVHPLALTGIAVGAGGAVLLAAMTAVLWVIAVIALGAAVVAVLEVVLGRGSF